MSENDIEKAETLPAVFSKNLTIEDTSNVPHIDKCECNYVKKKKIC